MDSISGRTKPEQPEEPDEAEQPFRQEVEETRRSFTTIWMSIMDQWFPACS